MSDRVKRGIQCEVVLLVAEQQPATRKELMEYFSGDPRQLTQAMSWLKNDGFVRFEHGQYELTDAGLDKAKLYAKKMPVPEGTPKTESGIRQSRVANLSTKISTLQLLQNICAPEIQNILENIQRDLERRPV